MSSPAHTTIDPDRAEPKLRTLLDRQFVRKLIRRETIRTGSPVFDEDLEQEALLRLCAAWRRIGRIYSPRAFTVKVVRDTLRDHWRSKRTHISLYSIPETRASYTLALETTLDEKRMLQRMRRALPKLDTQTRAVLQLFYFDEVSVASIATALSLSASAVKMILLRGRRTLRRLLILKSV